MQLRETDTSAPELRSCARSYDNLLQLTAQLRWTLQQGPSKRLCCYSVSNRSLSQWQEWPAVSSAKAGVAVSLQRSQPCPQPQPRSPSGRVRVLGLAPTRESQPRLQVTGDSRPLHAQRRGLRRGNLGVSRDP